MDTIGQELSQMDERLKSLIDLLTPNQSVHSLSSPNTPHSPYSKPLFTFGSPTSEENVANLPDNVQFSFNNRFPDSNLNVMEQFPRFPSCKLDVPSSKQKSSAPCTRSKPHFPRSIIRLDNKRDRKTNKNKSCDNIYLSDNDHETLTRRHSDGARSPKAQTPIGRISFDGVTSPKAQTPIGRISFDGVMSSKAQTPISRFYVDGATSPKAQTLIGQISSEHLGGMNETRVDIDFGRAQRDEMFEAKDTSDSNGPLIYRPENGSPVGVLCDTSRRLPSNNNVSDTKVTCESRDGHMTVHTISTGDCRKISNLGTRIPRNIILHNQNIPSAKNILETTDL